jgi:tetratricopeptide (TPR) repeat protein
VYQILVSSYFQTGQVQKLKETADRDLVLNPNDVPVLAVLSQTLARTYKANTPTPEDAAQQLAKAEQYSKRAIEVTPTLPKPANVADDVFANAKSDTLEMAHGSLGLVYLQRGKFMEAIPELEESIKNDRHPDPDPVNFYLLGIANDRTSHFDAAATAYTKCAAQQGSLQAVCKNGAEQSKKKSTTELSAPK